jgi:peptidoglycan hydrolase-like amidase
MISAGTQEPIISVGIADRQPEVAGRLDGLCLGGSTHALSGPFRAKAGGPGITLFDEKGQVIAETVSVRLTSRDDSTFTIFGVTIGIHFHWERREDQVFRGNLVLRARKDGTMAVINEIPLESYLVSVISSEMSGRAPREFLKAHAIMSRSWLMASLAGKDVSEATARPPRGRDELVRWYNREDHDIFDVCADDHCQRYQGITKIISGEAARAVEETRGLVLSHEGRVCDARYYKACGGITENYETAWEDIRVPYLVSIADSPQSFEPVASEETARRWMFSSPDAYCNTKDMDLLSGVLPGFDLETTNFFRWKVDYSRAELEEIIRHKSGMDLGALIEITPLERGPSGRIRRLRITGAKESIVIGKELEIRRWLSPSHLYSSAFVVSTTGPSGDPPERFIFHGAGWGHGVGLCQIGAAVMANKGFSAPQILKHYFTGATIERAYS